MKIKNLEQLQNLEDSNLFEELNSQAAETIRGGEAASFFIPSDIDRQTNWYDAARFAHRSCVNRKYKTGIITGEDKVNDFVNIKQRVVQVYCFK